MQVWGRVIPVLASDGFQHFGRWGRKEMGFGKRKSEYKKGKEPA